MTDRNKKHYWPIVALYLIIAGCGRHLVAVKEPVIYPAPPDTARIQYLTSFSNSLDITGKRSALKKTVEGDDPGIPVGKPYGIATSKGKIFICDATIKGLEIVDLAKKKFTPFIPKGKGQLKVPINCFIDTSDGKIYITDTERKEVVIFDDKLNYVTAIGNIDTTDSFRPMDVCVHGQTVWITNPKSNRINVYQKEGYKLLKTFPDSTAEGDNRLFNPINICYSEGKIFVTDFGDFKIKVFTEDGKYITSIGQYGKALGQFVRPKGISVDKDNNLYVVDAGFENVQMFDQKGRLLMFFGGPYKGPGDMWLPAKVHIDYDNLQFYKKWVSKDYTLKYLIFVTNQYGPDKVSVYGAVKPAEIKK